MKPQEQLSAIYKPHKQSQNSPLHIHECNNIVFGEGNPNADIMFIGEAPGKEEDAQGRPFVGRAGKLLNATLQQLGLDRNDVFITNVVKCRPPNNRTPTIEEIKRSKQLLDKEIDVVDPKTICTLGSTALRALFEENIKISSARGTTKTYNNVPVIPTYHPAYVLRNPQAGETLRSDIRRALHISTSK